MTFSYDPSTLATLLSGLANGQWVDTTPYAMAGVEAMDPKALAGALDVAQEINQKRQQAQLMTAAQRYVANAHLQGQLDTNDVSSYGHDVQAYRALQEALAHQGTQQNLMDMAKLKSATELKKGEAENASAETRAETMAGVRAPGKLPDSLAMNYAQLMGSKDAKLEQLQGLHAALKALRIPDESLQPIIDRMKAMSDAAASKPPAGPGIFSSMVNPQQVPALPSPTTEPRPYVPSWGPDENPYGLVLSR